MSFSPMSSLKHSGSPLRSPATSSMNLSKKRRMMEDTCEDHSKENNKTVQNFTGRRNFVKIPANENLFVSEEWKSKQTMFLPLLDDIMVNMRNIEQISFGSGMYFIADKDGTYCGNREGQVIHLWRFGDQDRKLYISRTFLISEAQVYAFVRKQLEDI